MKSRNSRATVLVAIAALAMIASGCSATTEPAEPEFTNDPTAVVTVWTDPTRQAGFETFQELYPDIKLEISPVVVGPELFAKIQLANRTGEGWPDVMFNYATQDIATLAGEQLDYALALDDFLTEEEKDGFGASNDVCTVDGQLRCLRNDVAPTHLWYNKALMDEFGYEVPTTWEEYAALGARVVEEHPGYVLGAAGDNGYLLYNAFQSVGCPMTNVTGVNTVRIDTSDDACTEVAALLDEMIANGSLLKSGTFDPETFEVAQSGKMLMNLGANWYGAYVFQPEGAYNFPEGVLAAAAPLALGSAEQYSGSQGGGIYVVSRHAQNREGAVAVAKWMATNIEFQTTAPTFPAFAPAAVEWSKAVSESTFYAEDPIPVFEAQVSLVNPVNNYAVRYDPEIAFNEIMVAAVREGGSLLDALTELQERLVNEAQAAGYSVE